MSNEWNDLLEEMEKDVSGGPKKYWQPPSDKEGTFRIRILPPLKSKGEKKFYFVHKVHWIDGTPYECLDQTLVDKNGKLHEAEPCPVCRLSKQLFKTASRGTPDWKLASSLAPNTRYIYRIVVRGKDDETQPEFYQSGKTIFNIIYHIIKETDYGVIIDPKNGRDFDLTKTGIGRQSKYDQSLPAANPSPIFSDPQKMKKLLENAEKMDYNSLIEFLSYDDLKKILDESLGFAENNENPKRSTEDNEVNKISENDENPKRTVLEKEVSKNTEENDSLSEDEELDKILAEFG